MTGYNFRGLGRFLRRSFFGHRGTNYRLTAKRLGVLLLSLAIYIPVEVIIWIGLGLDELIYPGYRKVQVQEPVFIIGNPRSGTTFLHRLLARDRGHFVSMKTWEIFLAPSVVMRRLIRGLAKVIRTLGFPIRRALRRWERDIQQENVTHQVRLRGPEEDEYLWIHLFSALKIWSFAGMVEETDPFVFFDSQMEPKQKENMLDFYHRCLQRHLYALDAEDKKYLAKNPNFSPMVDSLLEEFPEARFIYLVRDPAEAVPSHLSLKEQEWQLLGSPLKPYASRDFILEASQHWYEYPLQRLAQLPENRYAVIEFGELVGDARNTVVEIYQRFGWEMSGAFDRVLRWESRKARQHQSGHVYHLDEMGLSLPQIRDRFRAVYQRFQF